MTCRCIFFAGAAATVLFACADGTTLADPGLEPGDDGGALIDAGADTTAPPASPGSDASTTRDSAPDAPSSSDASRASDAPVSLACGKSFDFEANDGTFTHVPMDGASGASFDAWAYGAATGGSACHSGTKCFATNLSGPYTQCQRAELRSPVIDLSSCAGAGSIQVTFAHAYDFLAYVDAAGKTYYDGGILEMSGDGGATWTAVVSSPPAVGNVAIAASRGIVGEYVCPGPPAFHVDAKQGFINKSSGWETVDADVPAALRTSQFVFRFAFASGKSTADNDLTAAKTGWHIDDVAVVVK